MVISRKLAIVMCVLATAAASAHDSVQPTWRGQDGTTYQQWRFDNDANPAVPDVMNNPYGGTTAAITVGDFGEGWVYSLGFSEQTGIWDLGSEGTIVVNVSGADCNEIWVQVTYFKLFGAAPNVTVPGADYVGGQTVLVEDAGMGTAWYLDQSMWQLEQAADSVEIIINADMNGSSVDQTVVDTKSASPGCIVGMDDLARFCAQWLQGGPDLDADLDGSGQVDVKDFGMFANSWLDVCPPDWPLR